MLTNCLLTVKYIIDINEIISKTQQNYDYLTALPKHSWHFQLQIKSFLCNTNIFNTVKVTVSFSVACQVPMCFHAVKFRNTFNHITYVEHEVAECDYSINGVNIDLKDSVTEGRELLIC